jgi:hypothetical protein
MNMIERPWKCYITDKEFVLLPADGKDALFIDQATGQARVRLFCTMPSSKEPIDVWGLFGTLPICTGHVLLVVTEQQEIGTLEGHIIRKVVKALAIGPKLHSQTSVQSEKVSHDITSRPLYAFVQIDDDEQFIGLIQTALDSNPFYFSRTLDLSLSYQDRKRKYCSPPLNVTTDRDLWSMVRLGRRCNSR